MHCTSGYGALVEHLRRISALDQVAELLNWDQETQMPPRGAGQRAAQCGAVAAARHALASDPRLLDWIAALDAPGIPAEARVNLAEAARLHRRATRLPAALAEEVARATAQAQTVWEAAREANAFADFALSLGHVVDLKRAEAACLTEPGGTGYDALLDDYEPGMTAAELVAIFGRLRPALGSLRQRIAEAGPHVTDLTGRFAREAQLALSRKVGDVFGYDWAAGRLDLAAHPSSSGSNGDVRITTRVNEADPRECLYATMHELGHAVYEQALDLEQAMLPAGMSASMGVHESQSRLFENQLGRSRAFCDWLHPAMAEVFGDAGTSSPEALWRAVNRVETGFIRTEADEVNYNLHVMMRFDLERAMIAGDLDVADLEAAWNARFAADFGREVPDARRGVLQDVHWSAGLFGYFPTYALGNVYGAELHAAMSAALDLDGLLRAGETGPIRTWLGIHVHRRGRLRPPRVLIAEACGHAPTEAPLLAYLERKFGDLYAL